MKPTTALAAPPSRICVDRRPPRRLRRRATAAPTSDGGGGSEYVDGGTFTMALKGDPGKLDPQSSASSQLFTVNQLGYDNLVAVDAETRRDPVPARDGLEGRRHDRHPHPRRGHHLLRRQRLHGDRPSPTTSPTSATRRTRAPSSAPSCRSGATAKADDAAGTVTITLAQPAPFVLNGLASLPMVCDSGMKDRDVAGRRRPPAPARTCSPRPCPATTTPTRSATATPGARTARRRPRRACPTRSS